MKKVKISVWKYGGNWWRRLRSKRERKLLVDWPWLALSISHNYYSQWIIIGGGIKPKNVCSKRPLLSFPNSFLLAFIRKKLLWFHTRECSKRITKNENVRFWLQSSCFSIWFSSKRKVQEREWERNNNRECEIEYETGVDEVRKGRGREKLGRKRQSGKFCWRESVRKRRQ